MTEEGLRLINGFGDSKCDNSSGGGNAAPPARTMGESLKLAPLPTVSGEECGMETGQRTAAVFFQGGGRTAPFPPALL
jgi:hypothetical protein